MRLAFEICFICENYPLLPKYGLYPVIHGDQHLFDDYNISWLVFHIKLRLLV